MCWIIRYLGRALIPSYEKRIDAYKKRRGRESNPRDDVTTVWTPITTIAISLRSNEAGAAHREFSGFKLHNLHGVFVEKYSVTI
jgi:hypothetical protein